MSNKAYTLKRNFETEELHLFKGDFTTEGCNSSINSICGKMKKEDSEKINIFTCQNEQEARLKCATIGREVCGVCISSLYASID